MAKLVLTFEAAVLKEFPLSQDVVTIGRLPDNTVQIDNLAVSGHHAKIYWETDHYVVEDNNSLNGTYVNNRRVNKTILNNEDAVLVGKHTLRFLDEWQDAATPQAQAEKTVPPVPAMDSTVMLDTRQAKDMIARTADGLDESAAAAPARERIAVLTVMTGKTDQLQYVLSSKLSVIGKSNMASIKLKGWFAPKVAAVINRRDSRYFIAASEKAVKLKVNDAQITGQQQLEEGDLIEVAGVKMSFSFTE